MDNIFESLNFRNIFFDGKVIPGDFIVSSVDALATYLQDNANPNSPFMYLFAHNHVKTIIAYFAIIKAGFIVVLIDPDIKRLELNEMMANTPPSAFIRINKQQLNFEYQQEIIFRDDVEHMMMTYDVNDVCTIVYTAADDGYAKAAMLTRKNILANAQAVIECNRIHENSICCALLPFHHMFGLQTGVLVPILANGSLLVEDISDLRRLKTIADDIEKYKVSNVYSIPVVYYLFGIVPEITTQLRHAKSVVSGGYKLSASIFQKFLKKFGKEIHEGYGITEASPICTWHRPEDKIKLDSVGRTFSGCEIKILQDQHSECLSGQVGEICVKGQNVMKGYYHHEQATRRVLQDGWLHTGDLGKMDTDGYLYITGLKKRMLNVSGRNVYPAEVERLIRPYRNVEDIEVYGGISKLQGDVVKARIMLKEKTPEAEKAFKQWCLEHISQYKVPKSMEFY